MSTAAVRPSACPGLLRIVPARDGGICRVKLACGQLSAAQVRAIATAAQTHASGVIELTNRANLQIRGVRAEAATALIETLLAAGLGPRAAGGDDVRNLMVSPSFGIDPDMLVDVSALAGTILESLQTTPRFHELSPKFALLLDGGERTAMLEHPHDLWLSALPGATPMFAFGFAGCPTDRPVGAIAADRAPALVEAVLHTFLDCARPEQTRMRHLLQGLPVANFMQHVQHRLAGLVDAVDPGWQRAPARPFAHIGMQPQRQPGLCALGAVPPLGRIGVDQLHLLALIAQADGDGTLRVTPQQSVLLPNIPQSLADSVAFRIRVAGLSISHRDPLAHIAACSGSNGCAKARADTKADALQLADLFDAQHSIVDVHLSGCERSCAAAHVAPFTLLAVAPGRYDVYRRDAAAIGFGELIASDRDIAQIADSIAPR